MTFKKDPTQRIHFTHTNAPKDSRAQHSESDKGVFVSTVIVNKMLCKP
jgi:hypothetical protein